MALKKLKVKKISTEKYFEAIGRRKTAIARVRIWPGVKKPEFLINGKDFLEYLKNKDFADVAGEPFIKAGLPGLKTSVKVLGGGLRAQAYAIKHGLSRVLVLAFPESKKIIKTLGFLTRDPRMKERKKPGLKGARRAPQWSKR
jgi:small subunit ribosomal protein S9